MSMLRECDSCMRAGGALQAARQCCRPPKKPRPPINCPPGPREPEDSGAPMSSGPAGGSGALVYQLGTLRNCAECGGIELSQILADPECDYALDSPFVMVNRPGTYLVQYAVFLPEGACVNTVFSLQANEETLLSSIVRAAKAASSQCATYFGQALMTVTCPTAVCLASQKVIRISDICATAMATLSFLRIR